MRLSRFNQYVPDAPEPGETLVHNTLAGSYAVLESEELELLRRVDAGLLPTSKARAIVEAYELMDPDVGIVTASYEAEEAEFLEWFEFQRSQTEVMEVTVGVNLACNFQCTYCCQAEVMDGSGAKHKGVLTADDLDLEDFEASNDVGEGDDDLAIEAQERQARLAKDQRIMELFDELCNCLSQAAKGDIDVRIDTATFDGLAPQYLTVCANFNGLVDSLSGMLETINVAAETVRVNSLEISQVATDQSQRSEAQAATLEESAAGLKQLTRSVKSTAEHAARANEEIQANRQQAEESGTVVARTVEAMKKIEASSNQITEIITVIDDIAFQTNLLALNAGVEAARAGEAGRGFAVVASEVRALAQRASDSANEIKELIVNSGQHVQEGGTLVDQTGQALNNIIEGVAKVSDIVSSIATASRDQSDNLEEINGAVNELDKVTQQNAAVIEETSAASNALSQEAERLTDALARFRSGETLQTDTVEDTDDTVQVLFRSQARAGLTETVSLATAANGDDQDGWHDF